MISPRCPLRAALRSPATHARVGVLLALTALTAGCSDTAALRGSDSANPANGGDTGGDPEALSLRMDIYPSDATPELLPQSIELGDASGWQDLSVTVRSTIEISGQVTGFVSTPTVIEPTVPGDSDVPVAARIDVSKQDSIAKATVSTDSEGNFSALIPAGESYELVVVPDDYSVLPFQVRSILLLASDLELSDLYLDYGAPVWGQITHSNGSAASDVTVHLVEASTGAAGPAAAPNADGWYLLRAYEGDYDVVVEGSAGSTEPTVLLPVTVKDDGGARADVDLGPAPRQRVSGTLVDEAGQLLGRLDDYVVRLKSTSLVGSDGQLSYETDTDRKGRFTAEVMAGEYSLDIIPEYDAAMSPRTQAVTVANTDVELGSLTVAGRVPWTAQVMGPSGDPAANTLVVATELGFDSYTYSTTAGPDGLFSLELPDTPVELTLTPATSDAAITHIWATPSQLPDTLALATGTLVSGTLNGEGGPVSVALIELRDADGQLYASSLTDPDGHFELRVDSVQDAVGR